ncbi:MAG: UMP kinase [Phycisphaerae bacterium]|jgi:uridylate kinase|nr:UMP kinase [Phycisphaerae bacterium]HOO17266.1 UMP kinase [Phycisphaerae bacterium]HPC23012.1 UMP kinase [Phycisphaerae bacterium]HRS29599.1 UMP kinase [Phycisphaerae bacterium]HRT43441.1 UMP kinase [Phycisphaerae bacterium]
MSETEPRYKRVLLKVSGEGFCPPGGFGIHRAELDHVAHEIAEVARLGVQIGVVVGGGNFLRGARFARELGMDPSTADYMGMLGTVLNALALHEALERAGLATRVQSALTIARVCEPFIRLRAIRHLEKGRVLILAGGTGNPHVTTDSAAALRAVEIKAQALLKATKVDGVYDSDPKLNPAARRYEHLTYDQVIDGRLKVMDLSAVDLCQQHQIPIVVFNLFQQGTMRRVLLGEQVGTLVNDR